MANEVLNSILKEYEQKKLKAEIEAERKKEELYKSFPQLNKIEEKINFLSLSIAKNILLKNNSVLDALEKKMETLKYEKSSILQNLKLSVNELKPYYECPICNDTGYITNDNYETKMCNCLKQKLLDASFNKSNISNLDKENFDTFNENLYTDEIDLAKYRFNISPRTNIKNIKQKCIEFVKNFDIPSAKNLLFSGNTGLR